MSAAKAQRTRPYLTRGRRRKALLAAAAEIIETSGWTALTMVSLARHAGVSRQLVYQHFDSVDALLLASLAHIFEDVYVRTRDQVAEGQHGDFMATINAMQSITFDLPLGRARALWQAISISGTGNTNSEIASLSRRLRHLLIKTVQPLMEQRFGLSAEQARPLTWMLIVAFWAARQLNDEGELERDQAMLLFDWLVESLARGSRDGPPSSPKPKSKSTATVRKTVKTRVTKTGMRKSGKA